MSFAKDVVSSLIDSDQTKEYVETAVKLAIPNLVQFGLGFAVPFLSPVIIAASSHMVLKGLEFTGDKIGIADEKIEQYKGQHGTKGFLAKMASPSLGLLKKVFPATEKELYEALTDSSKLKQFFTIILENPHNREAFEENLKKFLTGKYDNFEQFQKNVKDTLGINTDRSAIEAYNEFSSIIYDSDILNKIIDISESSKEIKSKIEQSVKEIHDDFEKKYEEIKLEIINLRNNFYESNGLYLLTPNYFEEYVDIEQDFNRWKEGFNFELLTSIKKNREFRREKVVEEIKKRLEKDHRQLILGGFGTSKSTILMEIICDYYDNDYEILWNIDNVIIKDGKAIIDFIIRLLNNGNKVLVAVDDVHDERSSAIFYVMEKLLFISDNKKQNIRFILTASRPEYDLLIDPHRGLAKVPLEYRSAIQYFRDQSNKKDSNLKYEIPFFTNHEIKGFFRKYKEISSIKEEELEKIYKDTKGHPIMVKFSVLGNGLYNDVEIRYLNYLIKKENTLPDPSKIQTILVCSLLNISNLQITDQLLIDMEVKKFANKLRHALLYYNEYDSTWKTIHPRWDIELLSFLYNIEIDEDIIEERQIYLKNAIDSIFSLKDEQISASVIESLYIFASVTINGIIKIPIDVVENILKNRIPDYINKRKRSYLFALVIAYSYVLLEKYDYALTKCVKATEIDPTFADAWYNQGYIHEKLNNSMEAIKSYTKTIELHRIILWL